MELSLSMGNAWTLSNLKNKIGYVSQIHRSFQKPSMPLKNAGKNCQSREADHSLQSQNISYAQWMPQKQTTKTDIPSFRYDAVACMSWNSSRRLSQKLRLRSLAAQYSEVDMMSLP